MATKPRKSESFTPVFTMSVREYNKVKKAMEERKTASPKLKAFVARAH
jgi:hypothetical protein